MQQGATPVAAASRRMDISPPADPMLVAHVIERGIVSFFPTACHFVPRSFFQPGLPCMSRSDSAPVPQFCQLRCFGAGCAGP